MTSLLTKREVAALLNVGVRTVERLPIPRVQIPGAGRNAIVRYDREQVIAFIDALRTRKKVAK